MNNLKSSASKMFHNLSHKVADFSADLIIEDIGIITNISKGIVMVSGLSGASVDELIQFSENLFGITFQLLHNEVGVIVLGNSDKLQVGNEVKRTGRITDVPVSDKLIGRVIDPLGRPLDGKPAVDDYKNFPIERDAPSIVDRIPVDVPLQTGIKVIDALIPIGRGQRELILGDRQTGKTAIAVDTIINQKNENVLCVYCTIGQRASSIAKVISRLEENGALDYTILVVTKGDDSPGLKYIAPYAATRIAEYFMEKGRDVLIVYDDLTQHALAYREISLLMRRPPGREAYPGDIFYIHSRLLERSTHLKKELGGGSLTALPIIETEAENISDYIPTNLISITDGQIYLSPKLFELGIMPAVDIGKSVSRVGKAAQKFIYQSVVGDLKLAYSQFEELENFSKFGAKLDERTQRIIEHGKRIRMCLKQEESKPVSLQEQILILIALTEGLFDSIPLNKMKMAESIIKQRSKDLGELEAVLLSEKLSEHNRDKLVRLLKDDLQHFVDA
ncbi:MAG: alternate F1F0 ATPase, F1 subunit alpha [Sporocytophaga sp.]|nr:alternate F1F0 ATPase, F1 subunit alpha [Sporocytophaga sp.]